MNEVEVEIEVEETYQQAVESLKLLNNELFYSELKENIQGYTNEMKTKYDDTTKALKEFRSRIEQLPNLFNNELTKLSDVFNSDSEHMFKEIKESVNESLVERETNLEAIMSDFHTLQQNFVVLEGMFKTEHDRQTEDFQQRISKQKESLEKHREQLLNELTIKLADQEEFLQAFTLNLHEKLKAVEKNLLEAQEVKYAELLTILNEKMDRTEQVQKEIALSWQESAVSQSLSQKNSLEENFKAMMKLVEKVQQENAGQRSKTVKWLYGLVIGEVAIAAVVGFYLLMV